MGVFSSSWFREVWKEYDARFTVMLSLALQVVLIILGNRRKYDYKVWVRIVVWCAYLAADSVATLALGLLSNNLRDFSGGAAEVLDATTQLTAFWAPFLLVHLGGPDAVTSYALEDNELWLRHFLQVIIQTGVSVYVIYMAWTLSHLSFLSLLILFAGIIKYGERTWALRCASSEQLRQSLLKHQHVGREFHKFYRNFKIMVSEGYILEKKTSEEIVSQQVPPNVDIQPQSLVQVHGLLDLTKRLFLDSTLTVREKEETHAIFKQLSFKKAFQVIEIELGLIYDLMYTKAPLLYTPLGLCLRLTTFFLTFITLLLFTFLVEKKSFPTADLLITFFLLVGGISIEIYAALMLISYDRFVVFLNMQDKTFILKAVNSLPLSTSRRWSNKMPQYSLIKFSLRKKPMPCRNLFKLLNTEFKLEKWWYMSHIEVSEDLKRMIFKYFKKKAVRMEEKGKVVFKILPTAKAVAYEDLENDDPSNNQELGKRILFWHIITEVWYNLDKGISETKQEFVAIRGHCKVIKQISRYMLYLLVEHPGMVSIGLAQTSFQDISDVVRDIASPERGDQSKDDGDPPKKIDKTTTCKRLVALYFFGVEGVLGEALKHIQKMTHEEKDLAEKWNTIGYIWLEILAFAAIKCKGRDHGQQLRSGGEFLTHVWLLMAHFGLTDHFRQPTKQEIVKLVAK